MKKITAKLKNDMPQQYQCIECGLHYEDEATAKECAAWCSKTKSCNLEIIKKSLENRR